MPCCKSLEKKEPKINSAPEFPDYDFPEIPLLPEVYPINEEDVWAVPGEFLRDVNIYFELVWNIEQQYYVDKEEYYEYYTVQN